MYQLEMQMGQIDSSIQKFLQLKSYKNVTVFTSKGIARNNYGNWKIEKVEVAKNVTGFEFYAQKDLEMAEKANIGFMIWNGKSKGTFNNIINLLDRIATALSFMCGRYIGICMVMGYKDNQNTFRLWKESLTTPFKYVPTWSDTIANHHNIEKYMIIPQNPLLIRDTGAKELISG